MKPAKKMARMKAPTEALMIVDERGQGWGPIFWGDEESVKRADAELKFCTEHFPGHRFRVARVRIIEET